MLKPPEIEPDFKTTTADRVGHEEPDRLLEKRGQLLVSNANRVPAMIYKREFEVP